MPKVIKSTARGTVIKVHSFCTQQSERNEPVIPLKSVNVRVAAMTGKCCKLYAKIYPCTEYCKSLVFLNVPFIESLQKENARKILQYESPHQEKKNQITKCDLDEFD